VVGHLAHRRRAFAGLSLEEETMIYRYDFRYALAKIPVKAVLRLCFGKLVFVGKAPKERPVIFAPNHRNALIDALMLVYGGYRRKQIVFLARADIFRKRFAAWLLKGMRIMPVFRIRDGKDNLDKNGEIFASAARILQNNNPIALFPEARHNPRQSLLPVQKAAPRIVLPTEAQLDFRLGSQIVPVSIYYRDISDFLSDACVTFGAPIEVSAYKELYDENPGKAVNQLRQELERRLKAMVVDIWNDAFYEEYRLAVDWNCDRIAKEMFAGRKDDFLQASLHTVRTLDELFERDRALFDQKIAGFREAAALLKRHGLTPKDRLWNPCSGLWALALAAPLAALGWVNGIFPVLLNRKLAGLCKDKQFIPSVRYVSGLFFVPLFDLLQSFIVFGATGRPLFAACYFVLMPLLFYFSLCWRKWFSAALRGRKVRRFAKRFPDAWGRLMRLVAV
jgi:1-acyl-sn-glycerol-3-phosphate acyltransferase